MRVLSMSSLPLNVGGTWTHAQRITYGRGQNSNITVGKPDRHPLISCDGKGTSPLLSFLH